MNSALREKIERLTALGYVEALWSQHVEPRLDVYMGHAFERIAEQAYVRAMNTKHLPLAKTWGRWEGKDREGTAIEIDLVAALDDGRTLTGGGSSGTESHWQPRFSRITCGC